LNQTLHYSRRVKLVSWNVNGLRSVLRKNFLDYLAEESPDILCLQETKCGPNDVEQLWPAAYTSYWNAAEKKGYAGTAILTKARPLSVACGINCAEHDCEGRVLTAEYRRLLRGECLCAEFQARPRAAGLSPTMGLRLPQLLEKAGAFQAGDLLRRSECRAHGIGPGESESQRAQSWLHAEERAGFGALVNAGFIDTFREFEKAGGHYTWWSPMAGVRSRNIGWRIDYFLISAALRPRMTRAFIRSDVMGSDHCPAGIELA
jgi:exodeoxyribonuclease-3